MLTPEENTGSAGKVAAVSSDSPIAKSRRILFVDDDPEIVDVAKQILSRAGFQVLSSQNGKQALAVFDRQPVDLVITDLVMPELDGLELIKELRRRSPALPIVAISGDFGGRFLRVAMHLGAQGSLLKPFSREELLQAVRTVLGAGSEPR